MSTSVAFRWESLPEQTLCLNGEPLSLEQTLACGQAFRWWRLGEESWEGIAGGRVWQLRHDEDVLVVRAFPELAASETEAFLRRYLALDVPAREVHAAIAEAHPLAADAVGQFAGLRILRQDPLETVLTFTIATATNVPRVTRSVREICRRFGTPIGTANEETYHDFPTVAQFLAAPTDELFGPCNLAYRARSIGAVARTLAERPPDWLSTLRARPYPEAHRGLDELPFLGPKVADCACLFGLGFDQAVPVDVHVWAIAHELFGTDIPTRTLTPRTYLKIGERFREIFGEWAGWAQQYLFCARRAVPVRERFRPG